MGKSKSQTIGYKYFLGMHTILAQNIDAVLAFRFGDQTGWTGMKTGGQVQINRPELFGGQKKEGGVSGYVDVALGAASQVKNDYLQGALGAAIPAFRNVAALVFRQFYWGNNPYLKPLAIKAVADHSHFDDWYPSKVRMNIDGETAQSAVYIALDYSGSMIGTRHDTQIAALKNFLDSAKGKVGNSFRLVAYHSSVFTIERLNATDSDIDEIKAWLDTLTSPGGTQTNYGIGVASAPQFFTDADAALSEVFNDDPVLGGSNFSTGAAEGKLRRVLIFTTDGDPNPVSTFDDAQATLISIPDVDIFCFNMVTTNTTYTGQMDNTPADGVPIVSGSDPDDLRVSLEGAFVSFADMNPAHILRDALIAPTSDGSGDATEIGDSFTTAADTLYAEGLGLSFRWQTVKDKRSFKGLVEQHIDGICYLDSTTGKWELKLIRDDYDAGTIPVFDDSNVTEWSDDIKRPTWRELPNQIKVIYTKRDNGDPASVTISNIAGIQATGRVIQEERNYEGITVDSLASRIALRDLAARTVPLWEGSFQVTHLSTAVNLGSAIKINKPEIGLNNIIGRVVYISDPDGRDNSVTVRFAQDKYAIDDAPISGSDSVATGTDFTAQACTYEMVEEAPYYQLILEMGQTDLDDILAADPDAGLFHATGDQPTGAHINIDIASDAGAGWTINGVADFSPITTLSEDMTGAADDVIFDMPYTTGMGSVTVGSLARIGSEYLRVDAMTLAGSTVTVTFGRGCLDTVPARHYIGDPVFFWQGLTGNNGTEYTAGESVDLRLLPLTGADRLSLARAITNTVLFDSRAIRPYPPGKFQIAASYTTSGVLTGDLAGTWNHRDRTSQTTTAVDDHTAADIGPEAGVSYVPMRRMVVYQDDLFDSADIFDNLDFLEAAARSTPFEYAPTTGKTHTFSADDDDLFNYADLFDMTDLFQNAFSAEVMAIEFGVKSVRATYDSWQTPWIRVLPLLPPINPTATEV